MMTALLMSLVSIGLWPHGAPGPKASDQPEANTTKPGDRQVAGQAVIRLGPVTEPILTFYPAAKSSTPTPAVLVFPGGGYSILAYDLEGTEVCSWLNRIGISALLVKYRVASPGGAFKYEQPLQDAQRAMGLVRSHAAEWNIDPHKVGALGFSAGGHLAAVLSNYAVHRTYPEIDAADRENALPDFTILIYPAYLTDVAAAAETPATFVVQAEDDTPFIDGTLAYYRSLKAAKVAAELHLFSKGGHGYGLRATKDPVTDWPGLAEKWIRHVLAP